MKKLFFILSLSLMSTYSFAEKKEKKESEKKDEKNEKVQTVCCTATLTYNGQYVDHETVCLDEMFLSVACDLAKKKVLARHLEAAI